MPLKTISAFSGINLSDESTDLPDSGNAVALRVAENIVLRPLGGVSRPPIYRRLWALPNLRQVAVDKALGAADGVVLFLIRNEGRMVLAFYDVANQQSLGVFYAGRDPEAVRFASPTYTIGGYSVDTIWSKLAPRRMWTGIRAAGVVIVGNGWDDNLTFECDTLTIRKMGDGIRPLVPVVAGVDASDTPPITASVTAGNVTFYALEQGFRPIGQEPPYRRERGTYVSVAVVRQDGASFRSQLDGSGTLAAPYQYTVFAPYLEAGENALVNFIARDGKAHGLVTASMNGTSASIRYFPMTPMAGGRSQFAADDVFAGPYEAVCMTYVRTLADGTIQETMPSSVATTQRFEKGRVAVTVTRDTVSSLAAQYQTLRIYVADRAADGFRLYPEDYSSWKLSLEVPNIDGSYVIAPTMLAADVSANIEARPPPPCNSFIFAQNRIVMTGNPDKPRRAWFTKEISREERLPEGVGLFTWRDYPGQVIDDRTMALGSYRGEAVVFTRTTAWPLFQSTRRYNLLAGAVSSGGVATWAAGELLYLGQDGMIYSLKQPSTDASADAPDCDLALPGVDNYVAQYANLQDRCAVHSFVDPLGKAWWLWVRGVAGNMQAFQIRLDTRQLTGPFDFPQFVASTGLDEGDPRVIGCDLAGNLFVLDLDTRPTLAERFTGSAALVPRAAGDSTAGLEGFGVAELGALYFTKAQVMRMQTGWTNLGAPDARKVLLEVQFQVLHGSAGHVSFVVINERGDLKRRVFGEVFGHRQPHRVTVRLPGNFFQLFLLVIVADDQPFTLRSVTFGYDSLGQY